MQTQLPKCRRNDRSLPFHWLKWAALTLGLTGFGDPNTIVSAHQVEVSGDVAVMFHLEPNHNPKAGEPSQTWFVLTSQGGTLIPLADCDCQLMVYKGSKKTNQAPMLTPPLQAIAAEQYQGIPGAEIIFPQAGIYQLALTGKPKQGKAFQPFSLSYSVTVRAGQSPAPAVSSTLVPKAQPSEAEPTIVSTPPTPAPTVSPSQGWLMALAGVGLLGGIVWGIKRAQQSQPKS